MESEKYPHCSRGPVSSMPGSIQRLEAAPGIDCDNCSGNDAVVRVQGETDSMGCEYLYWCQACYDKYRANPEVKEGACDWCKGFFTGLVARRDYDEGMAGPIYWVCHPCVVKDNERAAEEYAVDHADDVLFDDGDFESPTAWGTSPNDHVYEYLDEKAAAEEQDPLQVEGRSSKLSHMGIVIASVALGD